MAYTLGERSNQIFKYIYLLEGKYVIFTIRIQMNYSILVLIVFIFLINGKCYIQFTIEMN